MTSRAPYANALWTQWAKKTIAFLEAENAQLKKTIRDLHDVLAAKSKPRTIEFKDGDRVRFKKPGKRTKAVGVINSRLTINSKSAYVIWPNGWAGWVLLEELHREQS